MVALRSDKRGLHDILFNTQVAVAQKPHCEGNRVIMGLEYPPQIWLAWTRRQPGGPHENPETIIRPTPYDFST
jgi:hypothetical protein